MANDTLEFQTIGSLTPGHPYEVQMRSFWVVNENLTIDSLYAPFVFADGYVLLTSNGQTNNYDRVYGCTGKLHSLLGNPQSTEEL